MTMTTLIILGLAILPTLIVLKKCSRWSLAIIFLNLVYLAPVIFPFVAGALGVDAYLAAGGMILGAVVFFPTMIMLWVVTVFMALIAPAHQTRKVEVRMVEVQSPRPVYSQRDREIIGLPAVEKALKL